MRIGVAIFATDRSIGLTELASAVEARGLDSLAVPEHTHMPREHTPHPAGGPLPEEYRRLLDPFVGLAAAAAVTTRIDLVTSLCLLAQRDPIVTAKEVASLDLISQGRVVFGVGYGWNVPEVEHHGVAFAERRAVVRERLALIRALWTDVEAAHHGARHTLAPSWSWPKPVREPHPPVLIGAGLGPRTLEDLTAVADGWMPIGVGSTLHGLASLHEAWQRAGRDGAPMVHTLLPRADERALARLQDAGVDAVSVWLPSRGRDEVLPVLDSLTTLVEEHRSAR